MDPSSSLVESTSNPASHASQVSQVSAVSAVSQVSAVSLPLVDRFGRAHRSLRISVTDRCNIRCQYCMPAGRVEFLPDDNLLTFDEIVRIVSALVPAGIVKLRITGGEPLVRPNVDVLVRMLRAIPKIESVALTTNGILLTDDLARRLVSAKLTRINISLDTLREEVFRNLSRRPGLQRVLDGVDAAIRSGMRIRLNTVLLRHLNLDDLVPLAQWAKARRLELRFIEFMPLDADRSWSPTTMVSGAEARSIIEREIGPLEPIERSERSQPAQDYRYRDGSATIGFIDSVTQPFCSNCDRLRLTAEGKMRNCLFGHEEWNIKEWLRQGRGEGDLLQIVRECVAKKHRAHGIEQTDFQPPERPMYQIGG